MLVLRGKEDEALSTAEDRCQRHCEREGGGTSVQDLFTLMPLGNEAHGATNPGELLEPGTSDRGDGRAQQDKDWLEVCVGGWSFACQAGGWESPFPAPLAIPKDAAARFQDTSPSLSCSWGN